MWNLKDVILKGIKSCTEKEEGIKSNRRYSFSDSTNYKSPLHHVNAMVHGPPAPYKVL